MALRHRAYCEARGFPKRAGGEDFYLLNKLAKLGCVREVSAVVITLEARLSDRVPFGTGPAVGKILALEDPAQFTYYAPEVFGALKTWLCQIPRVWTALQNRADPLAGLALHIRQALAAAGVENLWVHLINQVASAEQCERAVHQWFDGFQTLKFIRRVQATAFPARPLNEVLSAAEFMQEEAL